ncbi:MAG: hypothetical protein HY067_00045 [Betaproteobacteria bacterium]|nr:hypothetical protein [Betaproteobacteria bacterium]
MNELMALDCASRPRKKASCPGRFFFVVEKRSALTYGNRLIDKKMAGL